MQGTDSGASPPENVAVAARTGSRAPLGPKASPLHRYDLLAKLPPENTSARIFTFWFFGTQVPLLALLLYVLVSVDLPTGVLTAAVIVLLIALFGAAFTLLALVTHAEQARTTKPVPDDPVPAYEPGPGDGNSDEIGELMTHTQFVLKKLHSMIHSMHELSIRDELTGLYNRRFFVEQAEQLLSRAHRYSEPLTLIFIDMDNFKQINDRFSHTVGDQTLREVAELISSTARASDLTARLGGDEFVIVFPNTPISRAKPLCERLRGNLERHDWTPLLGSMMPTVSIGVTEVQKGDTVDMLIDRADVNLHKAKQEGRNQIIE